MDCAEEVHERSGELANSMLRLHRNLEQLSELNRMIKCQPQNELFAWLSKLATGTGNFVYQTGQLVQDFLGEDYMRPHLEEPESFKELMQMREAAHNLFVKVEKTLIEKKEKLFKAGDPNKWGSGPFSCFTHERQINELKDRLQQDKAFAFTYMLPKETQEYEQKKEELFFLTNQCLTEVQRVATDNGKSMRGHFKDMSHLMCSYINTVSPLFSLILLEPRYVG